MKTFRVAVVNKENGKVIVHKVQGATHTIFNSGGYNELRIGDEHGHIIARFNGWAWLKEVLAT